MPQYDEVGWYQDTKSKIVLREGTPIGTPPPGVIWLYADATGALRTIDDAGTDAPLGTASSADLSQVESDLSALTTVVNVAIPLLQDQIAAVGQPPTAPARGTYLVSGGRLIYSGSGYVYTITAGEGYNDGEMVNWSEQNVTLDAADATNDRIDVFVVNSNGVISAVKGTAAASPSKPDVDPALYLELTFALVYANTATPTGTSTTAIYSENAGTPTEWAAATSNAGTVTVGSTTDARAGTKCVRAVSATTGTTITLTAAAPIDPVAKDLFAFYIKILTAWNSKGLLTLQFYLGTVKKGNAVSVKPGENGLVATNTSSYQGQAYLIPQFGFPVGTTVDKLVITVTGATLSFALDDIQLQTFGSGVTVVSQTGITEAEADARYLRRDQALADLDSTNPRIRTINYIIGGGASEIADGVVKGDMMWDFNCTLMAWTLLADQSGAVKIDIWKDTYANFAPTNDDSICNGHEPEIAASAAKAQDTDLSDWADVTIAAGDIWRFNIDSCTTITCVTIALKVLVG